MQQPTPPTDIQALEEIMQAEEASLSEDQKRFLLDLEFVQALANPGYLRFLATDEHRYFEDADFLAYLNYLKYWKKPEYAKFIAFPNCLFFLDRLQDADFRQNLMHPNMVAFIEEQEQRHYNFYRLRRLVPNQNPPQPGPPAAAAAASAQPQSK